MTITIERASPDSAGNWNAFVAGNPDAKIFHRYQWQSLLESQFPYQSKALMAHQDDRIVGILPLMQVNNPLAGRALISNPLCVSAGPLTETPEARSALVSEAVRMADDEGVKYLELRDVPADHSPGALEIPDTEFSRPGWYDPGQFSFFQRDLPADPDAVRPSIPNRQRVLISRGEEYGLVANIDSGLDDFYRLYCSANRGHGTPPLPKRYFQALLDTFGDDMDILTARKNGRAVISFMNFYTGTTVIPYYGGSGSETRESGAYPFLLHALMKRAVERGLTIFDMGRSFDGSGAYAFKKNFGLKARPADYRYFASSSNNLPNLHPDNPKLRPLLAIWRHLPMPLTIALGNRIAWMAP